MFQAPHSFGLIVLPLLPSSSCRFCPCEVLFCAYNPLWSSVSHVPLDTDTSLVFPILLQFYFFLLRPCSVKEKRQKWLWLISRVSEGSFQKGPLPKYKSHIFAVYHLDCFQCLFLWNTKRRGGQRISFRNICAVVIQRNGKIFFSLADEIWKSLVPVLWTLLFFINFVFNTPFIYFHLLSYINSMWGTAGLNDFSEPRSSWQLDTLSRVFPPFLGYSGHVCPLSRPSGKKIIASL